MKIKINWKVIRPLAIRLGVGQSTVSGWKKNDAIPKPTANMLGEIISLHGELTIARERIAELEHVIRVLRTI